MHLLYLDESGSVSDPSQKYFVLAGVSVYETGTHWIEQQLDIIAARFAPTDPRSIELHGSPMRIGRGAWSPILKERRIQSIKDALHAGITGQSESRVRLFGVCIKKTAASGRDPVELAFEQLSSRFDQFLGRLYKQNRDKQRGLILFDKASTEIRIQTLAQDFKSTGHSWGKTRNYADVPVFLDSRSSRLIQLADLVAFALFRFHEHNDNTFYDIIKHRFDTDGGVEHGLYVYT